MHSFPKQALEVAQAFEDYQAGRLGTIPADHVGA